jgi:hypothetical protein
VLMVQHYEQNQREVQEELEKQSHLMVQTL